MTKLFRPPSARMPPKGREQTLEIYIKAVQTDTHQHAKNRQKQRPRDNLPQEERQAFKNLHKTPEGHHDQAW